MNQVGDATDQALSEFITRWTNAMRCFAATDKPMWKRTQEAMACFKGLPLDHLPRKLRRRIEVRFAGINALLQPYGLQT